MSDQEIENQIQYLTNKGHWHMTIYGSTGSGKTFYVLYLLLHLNYHSLYILCGGPGEDYDIFRGAYPIRDQFDYEEIKTWADSNYNHELNKVKNQKFILILDDIMGMGLEAGQNKRHMADLYSRFRHYNVSVITITHHLKGLPPVVRGLTTMLVTTKIDRHTYEILEEIGALSPEFSIISPKEFIRLLKLKKHQYAYFENNGEFYKFFLTV
jgi:hypothetical protein